uniref:U51-Theraphotoxin-Sfo1a_1 n=1 Tax=Selenotholus foelschei TaxID=1905327 RepID=A0A482ZH15_9ARAC
MKFAVCIAFSLLVCVAAQSETTCGNQECRPNSCCIKRKVGPGNSDPRCHPLGKQDNPCEEPNAENLYEQHCPCETETGLSCVKVEDKQLRCKPIETPTEESTT